MVVVLLFLVSVPQPQAHMNQDVSELEKATRRAPTTAAVSRKQKSIRRSKSPSTTRKPTVAVEEGEPALLKKSSSANKSPSPSKRGGSPKGKRRKGQPIEASLARKLQRMTRAPTRRPSRRSTRKPSRRPTRRPSRRPTRRPSRRPTRRPTRKPTRPARKRTSTPSSTPSSIPTRNPLRKSRRPTPGPTRRNGKTNRPTAYRSPRPTRNPASYPTHRPHTQPPYLAAIRNYLKSIAYDNQTVAATAREMLSTAAAVTMPDPDSITIDPVAAAPISSSDSSDVQESKDAV